MPPTNIEDRSSKTVVFRQTPETFELIGDRYLIEMLDISDVTPSGILIPGDPLSRGWEAARIVAVGNGHRLERDELIPMFFTVGDVVSVERLSGRQINMGGRDVRIVNQTAVHGRFTVEVDAE